MSWSKKKGVWYWKGKGGQSPWNLHSRIHKKGWAEELRMPLYLNSRFATEFDEEIAKKRFHEEILSHEFFNFRQLIYTHQISIISPLFLFQHYVRKWYREIEYILFPVIIWAYEQFEASSSLPRIFTSNPFLPKFKGSYFVVQLIDFIGTIILEFPFEIFHLQKQLPLPLNFFLNRTIIEITWTSQHEYSHNAAIRVNKILNLL